MKKALKRAGLFTLLLLTIIVPAGVAAYAVAVIQFHADHVAAQIAEYATITVLAFPVAIYMERKSIRE